MRYFFDLTLDTLLFILSFFVPKQNKTYLFGAGDGKSFKGNPKYFYLYIHQNHSDISPLWITENFSVYEDLRSRNLPVVHKYTLLGFVAILRSRYLVIEIMPKDIIYAGFTALGRFTFIQTFHGMPLKKIANDANQDLKGIGRVKLSGLVKTEVLISRIKAWAKVILLYKRYDIITASCMECSNIYEKAFLNSNTRILGFARNDIFYRKELLEKDYERKISITGYKKIISYVPTFRDIETGKVPFTETGLNKLINYLKKNNYIFLIKKHPYDTTLYVSNYHPFIRDISSETDDIMQLLAITDILITDYSSVFFDFMLSGKPVIYYSYDYNEYMATCRDMYYDFKHTIPGPFAESENELLNLIISSEKWFNKNDYAKKYLAFNYRFNKFHDGNSCKRLLEYIQKENL